MIFKFQQLNGLEDAQTNFEQIQNAFGLQVLAGPPVAFLGAAYIDSTLGKIGYCIDGINWTYTT